MPLIDLLLANYTTDVVAVYDDNFNVLWTGSIPMKCNVNPTSKLMQHPLETGATIVDHKVKNPVELTLGLVLSGRSARNLYGQIQKVYDAGTLLTVQTKASTYRNMVLYEMPHDEAPENYDMLVMALKLQEAQFVEATYGTIPASKVANKANASTKQRGEQTGSATPVAKQQSILSKVGDYFKPRATK